MNSEAKKRAIEKYNKKNYDKITIRVRKDETDSIKQAAAASGESLNAYILNAVKDKMKTAPDYIPDIERVEIEE